MADQFDPTLPRFQRLFFRYFLSKKCDNASVPTYVREPAVSTLLGSVTALYCAERKNRM